MTTRIKKPSKAVIRGMRHVLTILRNQQKAGAESELFKNAGVRTTDEIHQAIDWIYTTLQSCEETIDHE